MPVVTAKGMSRERVKVLVLAPRVDEAEKKIERAAFVRALRLAPEQVVTVDTNATAPAEAMLDGVNALIVAGAKWSVWEQETPNLAAMLAVVRAARARKMPIFGICFGAQLLAHASGGKVVRDEAAEERGTYDVTCGDDSFGDLLFADAPFSFAAQQSHHDRIASLPPDATLLASSERCPIQAFVLPGDAYGVQFHPEFSKDDLSAIWELRIAAARAAGDGARADALAAQKAALRESPAAEALLAAFIDRIVVQRG